MSTGLPCCTFYFCIDYY